MTVAATRRRYTRRQKLSAVLASDMVGVVAASDQSGVPKSTLAYWRDLPEFAEYRTKAREDLADEIGIVAHLAWQRVAEALRANALEPRDALFAADKATTLHQLVSGAATARTETVSIADALPDAERERLADAIDAWLAETREAG